MVYWWDRPNNMNSTSTPTPKSSSCFEFQTQIELFDALSKQNSKAYQYLYDQCYDSVEWFILKNSGTKEDAADYFQNAIASLCVNVADGSFEFRPNTKVSTYLIEICRRQWLGFLNSKYHKMTVATTDEIDLIAIEDMTHFDDLSVVRLAKLKTYFEELGATCKQILRLFYIEDRSMKDIAHQLSSTEGTVKVSRHRCVEQLKKHFKCHERNSARTD